MTRLSIFLVLVLAFATESYSLRAAEPRDSFTVNSVWQGMMEQSEPKSSYPVVLFVKHRAGNTFEGATWYPTLGHGLLRIRGQIDSRGGLTFTEDKLLRAEPYMENGLKMMVVAGSTFQAQLSLSSIQGTGALVLPGSSELMMLKFNLKLAE